MEYDLMFNKFKNESAHHFPCRHIWVMSFSLVM